MEHYNTVILGAGVTGLYAAIRAFAYGASRVLVIDKAADVGGILQQHNNKDYIFEFGVHVYNPNDSINKALFEEIHGKLIEDRKVVYRKHGTLACFNVDYPVQDHAVRLGVDIASEAGFDPAVYTGHDLDTFARKTFGYGFVNKFFKPFNSRVWTEHPEKMDSDWISGRVKLPTESTRRWGKNASFYHAPGDDITSYLHHNALSLGIEFEWGEPVSINSESRSLIYENNDVFGKHLQVSYDTLISTIPISELLKLCHEAPIPDLKANSVLSVGLGSRNMRLQNDLRDLHWLYMDVKSKIHRVSFLHNFHDKMVPHKDSVSLLLEIPFRTGFTDFATMPQWFYDITSTLEDKIDDRGWTDLEPEQVHYLLDELSNYQFFDSIGVMPGEFAASAKIGNGYPIPTRAVRRKVAFSKGGLRRQSIYSVGRWGSHGYFNLEDNFNDVESAFAAIQSDSYNNIHTYLYSTHYYKAYEQR